MIEHALIGHAVNVNARIEPSELGQIWHQPRTGKGEIGQDIESRGRRQLLNVADASLDDSKPLLHALEQLLTCFRQANPTMHSIEERHPQRIFERSNLLTDGRLG